MNVAHIWDRPRGSRRNFGTLRKTTRSWRKLCPKMRGTNGSPVSGYALVPAILVHSNGQIALNHCLSIPLQEGKAKE